MCTVCNLSCSPSNINTVRARALRNRRRLDRCHGNRLCRDPAAEETRRHFGSTRLVMIGAALRRPEPRWLQPGGLRFLSDGGALQWAGPGRCLCTCSATSLVPIHTHSHSHGATYCYLFKTPSLQIFYGNLYIDHM